jgi:hypothetical protein
MKHAMVHIHVPNYSMLPRFILVVAVNLILAEGPKVTFMLRATVVSELIAAT